MYFSITAIINMVSDIYFNRFQIYISNKLLTKITICAIITLVKTQYIVFDII